MRLRALRWSVALTLAVGVATAGVAVPHSSLRSVLRDVTRTAAAPIQAAAATGLAGPDLVARGHLRTPADAGLLAPAAELAAGLVLLVLLARGRRRVASVVPACRSCRSPPRWS